MHVSIKLSFENNLFIHLLTKNMILRTFAASDYKLVSLSRNLLKRHVNMFGMSPLSTVYGDEKVRIYARYFTNGTILSVVDFATHFL